MLPSIPDGALVRVRPLAHHESARRGEVVLARRSDGAPVIHRVVRIDGETALLQGDNLPKPDALIPIPHIIGVIDRVDYDARRLPLKRHVPNHLRARMRYVAQQLGIGRVARLLRRSGTFSR